MRKRVSLAALGLSSASFAACALALALAIACAACPSSSSAGAGAGDAGVARAADAAVDTGAPIDAALPSQLKGASTATAPYTSKEGLYTVQVPAGVRPDGTISSIVWVVASVAFAVTYYDGKPRGVDRTSFYDLARDKTSGSDIEKEEDVTLSGARAHLRRMRLVRPGKPVQWRRAAILIVGERTYQVSVMSPSAEDLGAPLANAFFDSFKLDGPAAPAASK